MNTIVVGYDDSEAAKRALARAAELAEAFKARVVVTSVAHVLVPGSPGIGEIGVIDPVDPVDPLELHEAQLEHAKAYLSERNIDAKVLPAVGDPAQMIVQTAENENADLIVVGTREAGFLDRILDPSVSAGVARKSHCDVLIVH